MPLLRHVGDDEEASMYPNLMHEIARYEPADSFAKRQARFAHEVKKASDTPQRRFRLLGRPGRGAQTARPRPLIGGA